MVYKVLFDYGSGAHRNFFDSIFVELAKICEKRSTKENRVFFKHLQSKRKLNIYSKTKRKIQKFKEKINKFFIQVLVKQKYKRVSVTKW
jgi:3-hydroxy-3-methylglutaryl CoA synthase